MIPRNLFTQVWWFEELVLRLNLADCFVSVWNEFGQDG
jgi:hypothetical protein